MLFACFPSDLTFSRLIPSSHILPLPSLAQRCQFLIGIFPSVSSPLIITILDLFFCCPLFSTRVQFAPLASENLVPKTLLSSAPPCSQLEDLSLLIAISRYCGVPASIYNPVPGQKAWFGQNTITCFGSWRRQPQLAPRGGGGHTGDPASMDKGCEPYFLGCGVVSLMSSPLLRRPWCSFSRKGPSPIVVCRRFSRHGYRVKIAIPSFFPLLFRPFLGDFLTRDLSLICSLCIFHLFS